MTYIIKILLCVFLLGHFSLSVFAEDQSSEIERVFFDGIKARNIGPWRGGRVTTVVGTANNPYVYYMGATGGLWKTTNAGTSWKNISDKFFKTAAVGAVDIAPSDPNLVIVGMGESPFRGVMSSQGDGIYKSTDAGKTWTHMGLEDSKQIGAIKFHPHNPEIIWVTVQGSAWAPTKGRGIYKSIDGGKNWQLVLETPNETTGALDLKYNSSNPRILFATLWDHQRTAWDIRSGGLGSSIWRSTDGGDTWSQLKDKGLPENLGKVGIAPSPAKPGRVWAMIETDEEKAGLYRSEDNGNSWEKINGESVLRSRAWYYMHVFADPLDENTVYVLNASFLKSLDGGKSFNPVRVPHGDVHGLWINPDNTNWMINANDGGANVSFDGGVSWSSQHNQPTAQFYRVNTDNLFPYNVYGAQQDNSTLVVSSRGYDGSIGREDYEVLGGCESGYMAFNPYNPRYIYSGCFLGLIDEYDRKTHSSRSIKSYADMPAGQEGKELKYRMNWNAPILVSRHDPNLIYHAGQIVLKSNDRGYHWTEISPDLTRNEVDKQGKMGRPYTNENLEIYNTIFALTESVHDAKVLWVGTDDGLLHITQDSGKSWQNITPRGIERGFINMIEASHYDPATAYTAVHKHKSGDDRPYIYCTNNFGKSWRLIVKGIPDNEYIRVVREDPVREGLLYAGTERGLYVSFDQGKNWQSLQLNLPAVPITDMKVQGNDLVLSTQGRAFWIIDDISPLRQYAKTQEKSTVHLYKPSLSYRLANGNGGPSSPFNSPNPPTGAVFYYSLSEELDLEEQVLKVEIIDNDGKVLRTINTDEEVGNKGGEGKNGYSLPAEKGINRAVWNLTLDPIPAVPGLFQMSGDDSGISGYAVAPGTYTLRLSVGEEIQEQPLEVRWDPNFSFDPIMLAEQQFQAARIYDMLNELYRSVNSLQSVKDQAETRIKITNGVESMKSANDDAKDLVKAIDDWDNTIINRKRTNGQNVLAHPPKLDFHLSALLLTTDGAMHGLTQGMRDRFNDLAPAWQAAMAARDKLIAEDLANFNANAGVAIIVPPVDDKQSEEKVVSTK